MKKRNYAKIILATSFMLVPTIGGGILVTYNADVSLSSINKNSNTTTSSTSSTSLTSTTDSSSPKEPMVVTNYALGDTFVKNGLTYQVIDRPSGAYPQSLKITAADVATCKLDKLAEDNTTGMVTSEDGSISLPVTEIKEDLFKGATLGTGNSIDIVIPATIQSIGTWSFAEIKNKVSNFTLKEGCKLIDPKSKATSLFRRLNYSGKVVFPNSIDIIPRACFAYSKISSIEFNEESKLEKIDGEVFKYCSELGGILKLPPSLTYIGFYAFQNTGYGVQTVFVSKNCQVEKQVNTSYKDAFCNIQFAKRSNNILTNQEANSIYESIKNVFNDINEPYVSNEQLTTSIETELNKNKVILDKSIKYTLELSSTKYIDFVEVFVTIHFAGEGYSVNDNQYFELLPDGSSIKTKKPLFKDKETWGVGDIFEKNNYMYQVINHTNKNNVEELALKIIKADYTKCNLSQMAENNETGEVTYASGFFGDIRLKVCELESRLFDSVTIGSNQPINIDIPASVEKIGRGAFWNVNNTIKSIKFREGLKEIGPQSFNSFKYNGAINFPATLEIIGSSAFLDAEISNITFAPFSNLKSINNSAFSNCNNLKSPIIFPASLRELANSFSGNSFQESTSYVHKDCQVLKDADNSKLNVINQTEIPLDDLNTIISTIKTTVNKSANKQNIKVLSQEIKSELDKLPIIQSNHMIYDVNVLDAEDGYVQLMTQYTGTVCFVTNDLLVNNGNNIVFKQSFIREKTTRDNYEYNLSPDIKIENAQLENIKNNVISTVEKNKVDWNIPAEATVAINTMPTITTGKSITFAVELSQYYQDGQVVPNPKTIQVKVISTNSSVNENTVWLNLNTLDVNKVATNPFADKTTNEVDNIAIQNFIKDNISTFYKYAPTTLTVDNIQLSEVTKSGINGTISFNININKILDGGFEKAGNSGGKITLTGFKYQQPTQTSFECFLPPELNIDKTKYEEIKANVIQQITAKKAELNIPQDATIQILEEPTNKGKTAFYCKVNINKYFDNNGNLQETPFNISVTAYSTAEDSKSTVALSSKSFALTEADKTTYGFNNTTVNDLMESSNQKGLQDFIKTNANEIFRNLPTDGKDFLQLNIIRDLSNPKLGKLVVKVVATKVLVEGVESTNKDKQQSCNITILGVKEQPATIISSKYNIGNNQEMPSDPRALVPTMKAKIEETMGETKAPNTIVNVQFKRNDSTVIYFHVTITNYYDENGWFVSTPKEMEMRGTGFRYASSTQPEETRPSTTSSNSGTPGWVWAIVVCAILGAIAIGLGIYFFIKKRK